MDTRVELTGLLVAVEEALADLPTPETAALAGQLSKLVIDRVVVERIVSPKDALVCIEFLAHFVARAIIEGEEVAKERR